VDSIRRAQESATAALHKAQEQQARHANKRRRPVSAAFAVGAQVLLSTTNLRRYQKSNNPDEALSSKLGARYIGPFTIAKQVNPVAFTLDLPEAYAGLHRTFHVSLLKPYTPSDARYPGRLIPPVPPPDVEFYPEGHDDHFLLERILAKRYAVSSAAALAKGTKGRAQWQIQWSDGTTSWEPKKNISRTAALRRILADFERAWARSGRATPTEVV
jgi:hypothetical protein